MPELTGGRILVVDDNRDDRELIRREITRAFPRYQVTEIPGPDAFQQALSADNFDLVVTDYQLQWSTGIKVLQLVKDQYPDSLVIMFTGTGTEEIAVEAMKKGLDDYLIKSPAHYSRLAAAINAAFQSRAKRRAEEDLRRALAEKELLLHELFHRVKNNMQIVWSLLDLQAATIKDPQILDIFRVIQSRVRAMALIHEKLYQVKDLTRISFAGYVEDLVNDLFASYGVIPGHIRLKLDVDINGDAVPVDTAVPCGLIINELLSNAIKYAFPNGRSGEVRVELHASENLYTMVVADNGVGFPRGFDVSQTESLGLRLVYALAQQQLKGRIELPETNVGVEVRITFAVREKSKR